MGRMNGPFAQPPHWQHHTIAPSKYPELQLLPLHHPTPAIALAFSIQQVGSDGDEKIKRGEGWRRSGRNSTCITRDQPYHRAPDGPGPGPGPGPASGSGSGSGSGPGRVWVCGWVRIRAGSGPGSGPGPDPDPGPGPGPGGVRTTRDEKSDMMTVLSKVGCTNWCLVVAGP